jgi:hypothetical protein
MTKLESFPHIKIKRNLNALPFLDTGFYLDPKTPGKFMEFDGKNNKLYEDIFLPGGVIASDVGSGKTVTTIGLVSVGS